MLDGGRVEQAHTALLSWYAEHGRDLPWRRTRDPYAILVAEVMLQQTQVERVIPIWHAWLARFPGFADLARATRSDAIRAWHGLGYNLRAVRLHQIAQQVVEKHDGSLPATLEGLLALKGVGRYTAGAVACFAFDQPVAMVDTNVRRVLGRVFLGPAAEPSEVARLAEAVVPVAAAYAWNQALMDLGATLCRARRPLCLVCPLREVCVSAGEHAVRERRPAYAADRQAAEERLRRGRVVAVLRELPAGGSLQLSQLEARLDEPLSAVVERLISDGLVSRDEGDGQVSVRLAD